ncbi:hypothetical protein BGX28_006662 [Mortierella sp. GBA30]|nr:hypothetical protein BGX28_006662 [Mortierella sp. GBA30]
MPTLVPQRTETLWYPRQLGLEHMHDELLQEEEAYENSLREVSMSSSNFIPVGLSKPFLNEDEDEEEDDEEEDEDDEPDRGRDMDEDLDADLDADLDRYSPVFDVDLDRELDANVGAVADDFIPSPDRHNPNRSHGLYASGLDYGSEVGSTYYPQRTEPDQEQASDEGSNYGSELSSPDAALYSPHYQGSPSM